MIKLFFWLLLQNCLLTHEVLQQMRITLAPRCLFVVVFAVRIVRALVLQMHQSLSGKSTAVRDEVRSQNLNIEWSGWHNLKY
jgi:hypothetical protein